MPISTRHLAPLGSIDNFRRRLQSLALLEAILSPEWESRYHSFDASWSVGEQMGSMRNGQGDDWFAHFSAAGCFCKGFDHTSRMSPYRDTEHLVWKGVLDAVPPVFDGCLREPAFTIDDTTFCFWRLAGSDDWQTGEIAFPPGDDPDGSLRLLALVDGDPETFCQWAAEYYDLETILVDLVTPFFAHVPLTEALVLALHRAAMGEAEESARVAIDWESLAADVRTIGYPQG